MFLVTGATGNISVSLIKQLDGQGQKVRILARDPKKAEGLKSKNVEVVQGDLAKPETLDNAFKGVTGAFVVVNASPEMVTLEKNAFDAAKKAGVKHVVQLSVAGSDPNSPITLAKWHNQSEQSLKNSGLNYSILQPMTFMQNTLMSAGTIKAEGKFYGAFGDGAVGMIDVADIAACAAAILTKPSGHEGKTYFLTGPEALTQTQVAEKLTNVLGKTVTYVNIPSSALVDNLKKAGLPAWFAEDFGKMSDFFATGAAANVAPTVEQITGRKPRSFDAFLADTAAAFK